MIQRYLLVFLILFYSTRHRVISIVLKASSRARRPTGRHFREFFNRRSTPDDILSLNPGISKLERLNDTSYIGHLTPLEFPGLVVTSVVEFDVAFGDGRLEVLCKEGTLKQKYEGNQLLASVFAGLLPTVQSKNVLEHDASKNELKNSATLEIEFPLPKWFPLPVNGLEASGSNILEKKIQSDLGKLLDAITFRYDNWIADKEEYS